MKMSLKKVQEKAKALASEEGLVREMLLESIPELSSYSWD